MTVSRKYSVRTVSDAANEVYKKKTYRSDEAVEFTHDVSSYLESGKMPKASTPHKKLAANAFESLLNNENQNI